MVTRAGFLTTRFGGYLHREVPEEDAELSHVGPDTPCGAAKGGRTRATRRGARQVTTATALWTCRAKNRCRVLFTKRRLT